MAPENVKSLPVHQDVAIRNFLPIAGLYLLSSMYRKTQEASGR